MKLHLMLPTLMLGLAITACTTTPVTVDPPAKGGDPLSLSLSGTVKVSEAGYKETDAAGGTLTMLSNSYSDQTGLVQTPLASTTIQADNTFTLTTTQAQLDAQLQTPTISPQQPGCTGPRTYSDISKFKIIPEIVFSAESKAITKVFLSLRPAGTPTLTLTTGYSFDYANGPATIDMNETCTFQNGDGTTTTITTVAKISYHKGWNFHSFTTSGTGSKVTTTAKDETLPESFILGGFPAPPVNTQAVKASTAMVPTFFQFR
ncbi:hypothetical protein E7T09_04040 [Deinococcus sp. KSM4-11]|uniref:hypothetical protein n=1 Tax=Deinococcus sp. KSM4-11 TaxID=2568654 RepID=UPI0010A434B7|nr:hypothetical protein [Deinococcus sp. KSM4-11]THF88384.1 hypothetical protein E7T09_04040 [Deinococcus sp. KSM4-11]